MASGHGADVVSHTCNSVTQRKPLRKIGMTRCNPPGEEIEHLVLARSFLVHFPFFKKYLRGKHLPFFPWYTKKMGTPPALLRARSGFSPSKARRYAGESCRLVEPYVDWWSHMPTPKKAYIHIYIYIHTYI